MGEQRKTIEGMVRAKIVPFSSVVGQSVMLTDETSAVVAQLSISIPSPRYPYRETADEIARIVELAINEPPSEEIKRLRARLGDLMVEDAKRMATAAKAGDEDVRGAQLERDAILKSILHHYGPEGVSKVLGSLGECKEYVLKARTLATPETESRDDG